MNSIPGGEGVARRHGRGARRAVPDDQDVAEVPRVRGDAQEPRDVAQAAADGLRGPVADPLAGARLQHHEPQEGPHRGARNRVLLQGANQITILPFFPGWVE